jgi:hypothetical protein
MMQPDHQLEKPQAARSSYENLLAGSSAAPGEDEMMAVLARKLSAQPAAAAPALLGTDLPLLASQVAAAHSYRHAYGPPAEPSGNDTTAAIMGSALKVILITDHSPRLAGPSPAPDAQSGKPVNLKRRKVNANRFRARPNKPPE